MEEETMADKIGEMQKENERLRAQLDNAHAALDVLGTPRDVESERSWGTVNQELSIEVRLLSYFFNGG